MWGDPEPLSERMPEMKTLESPLTLASPPSTFAETAPEYRWDEQRRYGDIVAGTKFTSNSQQTFDNKGLPKDANSDRSDD